MSGKIATAELTWAEQRIMELPEGTTLYGIIRHVSRSGMTRVIDVLTFAPSRHDGSIIPVYLRDLPQVGWRVDRKHDGLVVHGCGMDMLFHAVYTIGMTYHGDGYYFTARSL